MLYVSNFEKLKTLNITYFKIIQDGVDIYSKLSQKHCINSMLPNAYDIVVVGDEEQ